MGNSNSNSMNKVTILFVSGKKKDRDNFCNIVNNKYGKVERHCYRDYRKYRKLIATINQQGYYFGKNYQYVSGSRTCTFMIFENIDNEIIQNIGDEVDNMILDIRLNKVNKCVKNQQVKETLELLEKL